VRAVISPFFPVPVWPSYCKPRPERRQQRKTLPKTILCAGLPGLDHGPHRCFSQREFQRHRDPERGTPDSNKADEIAPHSPCELYPEAGQAANEQRLPLQTTSKVPVATLLWPTNQTCDAGGARQLVNVVVSQSSDQSSRKLDLYATPASAAIHCVSLFRGRTQTRAPS